ncbi:MAG: DNA polymerase IV [Acholeplasmataceae bacterium]|nr:DNA polymerase IV [Acholeplasmataceae bacterium]
MKKNVKIIFHIDLNAFFASCHMIVEPYLKDKVFVVGGSAQSGRGVVSTASYKARQYGIHSAMSIPEAMALFPKLLVVPTDFKLYQTYSKHFFDVINAYGTKVLQGSIDEAYIDMTDAARLKHPLTIARDIQDTLLRTYRLPCSIGIAPTLFLAKMASDMKKPLGITVIRKKEIVEKLFPQPISDMYGIGKKTYPRLMDKGIMTIGDFVRKDNKDLIIRLIGLDQYHQYLDHIMGRSSNIIEPEKYRIPKSVSSETTINYAIEDRQTIFDVVKDQFEDTYRRLIKEELVTRTVGIKLKNDRFETKTRSMTLDEHTDDKTLLFDAIETIFETEIEQDAIRLAGVFFNQVMLKKDLKIDITLFNYQQLTKREQSMYQATSKKAAVR